MANNRIKTISKAELKVLLLDTLNALPDDAQITFGNGDLSFSRCKERGPVGAPPIVNIEFNELYRVTLDPSADDTPA